MPPRSVQGVPFPSFLYGTAWKEGDTAEFTRRALDAGFRGVDTANQRRHYVEEAVGEAVAGWIASTGAARADVFLQTKFTFAGGQDHRIPYDRAADPATQVAQSLARSLEHLRTTYVDSFVLHGPSSRRGLTPADRAVWRAMEGAHASGTARLLGVSNVSLDQLQALHEEAIVKPAFVQNRCFATTGWDRDVRAFCAAGGIVYQGFSLLTANVPVLSAPVVLAAAERTRRQPAEVVFAFALRVGMLPLTGTSDGAHMRGDLAAGEIELSDAEVAAIEGIASR